MSNVSGFLVIMAAIVVPSSSELRQKFYKRVETCVDLTTSYTESEAATRSGCAVGCASDEQCVSFSVDDSTSTITCYRYTGILEEDGCQENGVSHFTINQLSVVNETVVCENGGVYEEESNGCSCDNSYTGDRCERLLLDCFDGVESRHYPTLNGVYNIQPALATQPFQVNCEANELRILDRRKSPTAENYTRGWVDYREGFGSVSSRDSWLGLEKLYWITNSRPGDFDLVVRATFNNNPTAQKEAIYHGFKVSEESLGYSFSIVGVGTDNSLSDCLGPLQGQPFSTVDADNDLSDGDCAATHQSGWWFKDCSDCSPTGKFQHSSQMYADSSPQYLKWPTDGGYSSTNLQMVLVYVEGTFLI